MADQAVAELTDVTVRFPRRAEPVLRGVSVRVAPGEHVLLIGPSGSGKSTVLAVLSGVVPHTVVAELSGHAEVAGTPTHATSVVELSRHVAVLAQDPAAAVCLPLVEQELALPQENRGVDPATIGDRVDRALAVVGAGSLRGRRTAELSGGEAQRVALAAALVADPDLLLLDEPTSMLDPAGVRSVRDALGRLRPGSGPAVVLVEHRLDELAGAAGLEGLPPRAVVLDEAGQVLADGPTREVLRRHSGALHRAGCWLPLEAELSALTGCDGGLAAETNRALLSALATGRADVTGAHGDGGPGGAAPAARAAEPVLVARGLAVARRGPEERARRRPGRRPPWRRTGARPVDAPDATASALLHDVDLDVRPGEVVALLGPNGVGKTSLLLTLAGLLPAAAGSVTGPRAGLVFQNAEHGFVAHTVRDEIAHGLPAGADAAATVADALRTHRLDHLADQNPFRLSGGEKRRLSLAAMLAHPRPVLLADEPTLGLDRRDTVATLAALRRAATGGRAVVLSSHDLRVVATVADRAVVVADGTVVADGPVTAVLGDPVVLVRAGLRLPPLVRWLLDRYPDPAAVRAVLAGLDRAVGGPAPAAAPVGTEVTA